MCFVLAINDLFYLYKKEKPQLCGFRCELCHFCVDKCDTSSLTQHRDLSFFFLPRVLTGRAQLCGGMNAEAGRTCLSSDSEPILSAGGCMV